MSCTCIKKPAWGRHLDAAPPSIALRSSHRLSAERRSQMTNVASKEGVHYFSRKGSVFPPPHAKSQGCQSGDGRNEVRSTNGKREDEKRGHGSSGACHIPSSDKIQRCHGRVGDPGGQAKPSRAHLALPWLCGRLAVGGGAPIILDSIIKCRVITRYGVLLLHPTGREGGGWVGVDRYGGGHARGDGGVCADVSGAVRVCVSRGGEGETRRRKSWREGTVTGPRGGNEMVVCVCCVGEGVSKFRRGGRIDFDWRAMLWRGAINLSLRPRVTAATMAKPVPSSNPT